MTDTAERVLTHHVNVRNPRTGKVHTYEPGADLPKWAADLLLTENHVAYPVADQRTRGLVKRWQASRMAAEAELEAAGRDLSELNPPAAREEPQARANQPDVIENRTLDYLTKGTTPAALTAPIRVRLLSALGTADAAGTPITGGTTPTRDYGAVANTQVAEGAQTSNGVVLRYEGLPNPTTVAGMQLLDSTATPVITLDNIARTGGSVSVTDGILEIAAGGLTANSK